MLNGANPTHPRTLNKPPIAIASLCIAAIVVAIDFDRATTGIAFRNDFSKWRPQSVYDTVLGERLSCGITNLRASGRDFFL